MKRPAFQFYPGDWMRDAALRLVSVSARGLWIDMICLMHEGTPYGFLKVNHNPILPTNLARIVGAPVKQVEGWLKELEDSGVFSRDEAGSIFSRRMIRDEEIRVARAAGGSLGGNPNLKPSCKDAPKVDPKVNLPPNLQPTPSSSVFSLQSSTAVSESENKVTSIDSLSPEFQSSEKRSEPWPSLDECLKIAEMRAIPQECAFKWWHEHDAIGGCEKLGGKAFTRWQSALVSYATTWRANETKEKMRNGGATANGAPRFKIGTNTPADSPFFTT